MPCRPQHNLYKNVLFYISMTFNLTSDYKQNDALEPKWQDTLQ